MSSVYLYRVYCIEEAKNIEVWGTEPPTICPNNHSNRTINSSSITIIDKITRESVIATDAAPDDGFFQATSEKIDIPNTLGLGEKYTYNKSFPHDIYVWNMNVYLSNNAINDTIDFGIGLNTTIGTLSQNANSSSNSIVVSDTVMQYIGNGLELAITDGTNTNHTGIITQINTTTNTITFSSALTNSFFASSPTYIKLMRYTIRNFVSGTNNFEIGRKGLKAMRVPANTTFSLIFTNTSGITESKNVYIKMEYYMK